MFVGVAEAKSTAEIAHCVANAFAYGLQGSFADYDRDILDAMNLALKLEREQMTAKVKSLVAKNASEARGIRKALKFAGITAEFKSPKGKKKTARPRRRTATKSKARRRR